jgi:hypothetical protein
MFQLKESSLKYRVSKSFVCGVTERRRGKDKFRYSIPMT